MSLLVTENLFFKENYSKLGNHVEKIPQYLKSIFEDEYSPFKTYLDNIAPNCELIVHVKLEAIRK